MSKIAAAFFIHVQPRGWVILAVSDASALRPPVPSGASRFHAPCVASMSQSRTSRARLQCSALSAFLRHLYLLFSSRRYSVEHCCHLPYGRRPSLGDHLFFRSFRPNCIWARLCRFSSACSPTKRLFSHPFRGAGGVSRRGSYRWRVNRFPDFRLQRYKKSPTLASKSRTLI